ncbi:hypothetical protein [Aestuariimicrobium kwangyangense]|uniref:hypothetical protein n=1 Tax=Aestuariimicrobium kwangyangense TaxID=396389 RepID=UPI0003B59DD0|nr:hypothetical protein [Aestuariimicrobium kwangyangense]
MPTDFRIDAFAVVRANAPLQDAESVLAGLSIPAPDPAMYGQLVGSAGATTEPRTTDQHNDVVLALSEVFGSTSDGLAATGSCYQQVESGHVELIADAIVRGLN